ncbi:MULTISPECIES: transporter [unclassified Methylobacterium]|uniref:transporter n=1 Tax=unclassified Methylobacterium TaxID=2615210 RepID=UPI001FB8C3AB|nr:MULTISPECIES: transporter [unclassified Methylobacterium]MCJ2016116.1 transporter [Methylobacterium sp. E-065]MCJ2064646.1 transporter [Methylobacterium sp. J-088]
MMKNWLAAGTVALTVGMTSTIAQAQTTTVPGEQVGLAVGAPLPEGLYAINTFTYRRTDGRNDADTAVNVPVLVWSTPLVPLGGRVELLVAPPTVFVFTRNPAGQRNKDISINVGTFVGGIWAFDLGSNFGVSLLGGVYLNDLNGDRGSINGGVVNGQVVGTPVLPQLSSNTYRFGVAGSYTGDGWNITGNLTANIYDSPGRFPGQVGAAIGPINLSDSLNFDITATKKFGNFEIGPIAYGTYNFDISQYSAAAGNRGRFAVGGLIGYDFKIFTVQAYVARDVVTGATLTNAFGRTRSDYSTDGWIRFIVPLYSPVAAATPVPAPLVRKY